MNRFGSFPNRKRFTVDTRQVRIGFLMNAFSLPANNIYFNPRSRWNGKPVCQPRVALASRNVRIASVRRKVLRMSQRTDETDPDVSKADLAQSERESENHVPGTEAAPRSSKPTSVWLFVIENAVQVTILALAIAGSIHTRRRVLVRLVSLFSLPYIALIVNRIWLRIRVPVQPLLASADSTVVEEARTVITTGEDEVPLSESVASQEEGNKEYSKGELTLAQSKMISTTIRTAVAEEVDSLRYAIEQIEQTTEQRQQARNIAIAEAIASLDGGLRSLRRSIDTRNQVEKSAPFALVSELEIVKSRLRQAEEEKAELEVRLRAAEDNFEEAKRQGERARREADEASSKELSLRTELAVASSRLFRLEEVTERLEKSEQRNAELQEELINGTRAQEGLRYSAEDAERRAVKVENVVEKLREKIKELTGKPLSRYEKEGGDFFEGTKEKSDDQFWPERLRGKGDLRPDSLVYQELLKQERASRSPQWPHDPLGIVEDRQDRAKLKLPDDGGFGVGETFADQSASSDAAPSNKLLTPEGSSDTIFSFSRGEFDDSKEGDALDKEDTQSLDETSKSPLEASSVSTAPEDSSEENEKQNAPDYETPRSEYRVERPSKVSSTRVQESSGVPVDRASVSSVDKEASDSRQYKSDEADAVEASRHVQVTEGTEHDIGDKIHVKKDMGEDKETPPDSGVFSVPAESASKEAPLRQKQDQVSYDAKDQIAQGVEKMEEYSGYVEQGAASRSEGEGEQVVEHDITDVGDTKLEKQDRTVPAKPIISAELTSDSDQGDTASSLASDGQSSEIPSPEATPDEAKEVTVQKTESYLETLSAKEASTPVESIEEQRRSARELVKKARTRGLAVKQADILFGKATMKLERALEQVDDRSEVEGELGGCLLAWAKTNIADGLSQQRLSRAQELLTRTLESQPENEKVLFNTGLCLCLMASTSGTEEALQHYERACVIYEKLLELNDKSRMACFNCGLAYVSLGRLSLEKEMREKSREHFERAAGLFQRSLELQPGDSKGISYLDDCRRQLAELGAV